ncbi:MAG: hypothetical protein ACOZNI_19865 [Myxococcota bacterium]
MTCSEVKVLVPPQALDRLTEAFALDAPRERIVTFFETPERELHPRGVILRLRAKASGKKAETTVKLRGYTLAVDVVELLAGMRRLKGEHDCSEATCVAAVSLANDLDDLPELARPRRLFSQGQRALASWGDPVPWSRVRAVGPIAASTWKVEEHELTIEHWRVGADALVEVSGRTNSEPEEAMARLRAQLAALGVDGAGLPGGKTSWALDRLLP